MYLPLGKEYAARPALLRLLELIGHDSPEGPALALRAWQELGLEIPADLEPTEVGLWRATSPVTWTWEAFGDVAFYGTEDGRRFSHVALVVGYQLVMTCDPWIRFERPRYRPDFLGIRRLSSLEFGA